MRISEKAHQIEKRDFFHEWLQLFWLEPPMKKIIKLRNVKQLILRNVQNDFLICPFSLKEYDLFRQNTEISLEQ